MLTIPHYLNNRLIDGVEVVSLTHRQLSTPQKYFLLLLVLVCVKEYVSPKRQFTFSELLAHILENRPRQEK
jgi:hypothetical protein